MLVDTHKSWIIVGACFYINTVIYGVLRLSGILFVETMNKYNVGRIAASFPYTFSTFMKSFSGPVYGYLGRKLGITHSLMIGSWLCTIGIGACFFVEDAYYLTLFYGIIFGSGCGSFLQLPTLINQHFDKYRGIASGVLSAGIPLGLFILSPITEILLKIYGLSGSFLIISGLLLNCVPATMIIKLMKRESPRKWLAVLQMNNKKEIKPLLTENSVITIKRKQDSNLIFLNEKSLLNFNSNSIKLPILNDVSTPSNNYKTFESQITYDTKSNTLIAETKNTSKSYVAIHNRMINQEKTHTNTNCASKTTTDIKPLNYQTTIKNVSSILLDPILLMLTLQHSLLIFSSICLTTIILDFANDIGISENIQANILMTLALGELFGPFCLSWIIDKSYISKPRLLILSCFLQAPIFVSIPFSNGPITLLCLLWTFGFTNSPGSFITPLLIADYIDAEKQTIAMTLLPILVAPLSLLISPIIGYLRDNIGSYDYLFYGLGIVSFIRGFLILFVPCLWKRRQDKSIGLGK